MALSANNVSFNGLFEFKINKPKAADTLIKMAKQPPYQASYDTRVVQDGDKLWIGTRSKTHDKVILKALEEKGFLPGEKFKYTEGVTILNDRMSGGKPIVQKLNTVI